MQSCGFFIQQLPESLVIRWNNQKLLLPYYLFSTLNGYLYYVVKLYVYIFIPSLTLKLLVLPDEGIFLFQQKTTTGSD